MISAREARLLEAGALFSTVRREPRHDFVRAVGTMALHLCNMFTPSRAFGVLADLRQSQPKAYDKDLSCEILPYGSKYPKTMYLTKTILTIPNVITLNTLYLGTLDP